MITPVPLYFSSCYHLYTTQPLPNSHLTHLVVIWLTHLTRSYWLTHLPHSFDSLVSSHISPRCPHFVTFHATLPLRSLKAVPSYHWLKMLTLVPPPTLASITKFWIQSPPYSCQHSPLYFTIPPHITIHGYTRRGAYKQDPQVTRNLWPNGIDNDTIFIYRSTQSAAASRWVQSSGASSSSQCAWVLSNSIIASYNFSLSSPPSQPPATPMDAIILAVEAV